ncbi:DUF4367 domain-containing protein [Peribacillus frigoritolerans]|uniref:DUF4367 domain-containing protein n=1 Tax=Peribacillus frigoritolerans TaxID=450367 RepID=UPI0007BF5478|nr:DUF4367 domain-containing protein [Peribacillus frigoritolerans]
MKKLWKYLLLGVGVLLIWLFFYTDLIKYPVSLTDMMVGIKAEPNHIPFDYEESYATIRSCGKRCDNLNIIYEGSKERLVVIATNYVSWADDPKWGKNTIVPGTNYYYQNNDGKQLLFWKDEKEELELGLEYTGEKSLPKEELIKIAKSIKAEGKQLD